MLSLPRKSKKRVPEAENSERWLITYSDLITLLLIFFVIMYAMSKVDTAKFKILAQSLSLQHNKAQSIMQRAPSQVGSVNPGRKEKGDTKNIHGNRAIPKDNLKDQQLQKLMTTVTAYIQENHLSGSVSVNNTERGIAIRLNDVFLFDTGKADLRPPAFAVLNKLSTLFSSLNAHISIEGNTDNIPLATGSLYVDNWGLGSARALSVLRYFVYDKGLTAGKFSAVSYGDTHPVVKNDTPADRQKNRRVEIVILRDSIGTTTGASNSNDGGSAQTAQ